MPQLDGVSATAMIRMVTPRIPIIAMTSNIRQEDIQTYFQFGKFALYCQDAIASNAPRRHERRTGKTFHQGRHGAHSEKAPVLYAQGSSAVWYDLR